MYAVSRSVIAPDGTSLILTCVSSIPRCAVWNVAAEPRKTVRATGRLAEKRPRLGLSPLDDPSPSAAARRACAG